MEKDSSNFNSWQLHKILTWSPLCCLLLHGRRHWFFLFLLPLLRFGSGGQVSRYRGQSFCICGHLLGCQLQEQKHRGSGGTDITHLNTWELQKGVRCKESTGLQTLHYRRGLHAASIKSHILTSWLWATRVPWFHLGSTSERTSLW